MSEPFDLAAAVLAAQQPGFKITVGYKLTVPFKRRDYQDRREHYFRHGLSKEAWAWLTVNMGPSTSFVLWQLDPECTTRWLYTGSQQVNSAHYRAKRGEYTETITIWFRDKRDAMLFKVRWWGDL